MNQEEKAKLLKLAARYKIEIEPTYMGDVFITYEEHRIFFNWHQEHDQWFFSATRIGAAAMRGYAGLGCEWFDEWASWYKGIAWGKALIDQKKSSG